MKKALIAIAIAAYASTATALIENSLHDLHLGYDPGTGVVDANFSSCQFCHAPHYGNTTGDYGVIPLWNRVTPSTTNYSLYTLVNSTVSLGAGSFTCLSCHDGTSDMGQSFSGSAGFVSSPVIMANNRHNLEGTMSAPGTYAAGDGTHTNLTDDHPVGVIYTGGAGTEYKDASTVTAGTYPLKLYSYTAAPAELRVECGSCHDPHDTNGFGNFLRKPQNELCSTCHAK